MKDTDELLRRHRVTPTRQLRSDFTSTILDALETRPPQSHLARLLQEFHMRLLQLPKVALIALAIVVAGAGTTAAYAAYSWLIPKITVLHIMPNNDDNKREFLVNVQDCGVVVGGQTADNGQQRYEVSKDANLTNDQVIKVIKNSCEFQQLIHVGQNQWHDNSNFGAGAANITNDPPLGTITAMDATHVTITSKVYQEYDGPNAFMPGQPIPDPATLTKYFPTGKDLVRTFSIAGNADVLDQGKSVPLSSLKVGETVFFMSTAHQPDNTTSDLHGMPSTLVHFVKTDVDPQYVQPMSIGNPSIINAVTRLTGCQGNGDYLCVDGGKTDMNTATIYASDATELPARDMQAFAGNEKYFRADIDPIKITGDEFHHIEGRITALNGTEITLQARGKTQNFTINLPYDAVKVFDQKQSQKVNVGDYIEVSYIQKTDENHTAIQSGDLTGVSILLRQLSNGSFAKY